MSTSSENTPSSSDPFELWRQIYEANERAWNGALEKAMATPAFAEQSGKVLETFLSAQKAVRENMRNYLQSINIPTREDVSRLGELIVNLEEKVDQVLDRLDELEQQQKSSHPSPAAPPPPAHNQPTPASPASSVAPATPPRSTSSRGAPTPPASDAGSGSKKG